MAEHLGVRFGRLTVVADAGKRKGNRYVVVRCECGQEKAVRLEHLRSGATRSCGCLSVEVSSTPERVAGRTRVIHGHTRWKGPKTPEYRAWSGMIQRCLNTKLKCYKNYGGRGIRVCDEWRADFRCFLEHIGPRPSAGYSIDRINNDGHYEPGNVRWATRAEQNNNQRAKRPRKVAA